MADRRQVLRALLMAAAGLAVPASCGLPSGGHPIVDGAGPAPGGAGDGLPKAPTPADASEPGVLVQDFLAAVAGRLHSDGDLTAADERAKKFLTGQARAEWPAPTVNGITVVRVESDFSTTFGNAGTTTVKVTLRPTGTLGTDGTVSPPNGATSPRQLTFTVVQAASGYLIDKIEVTDGDPLAGMMLDGAKLDGRFFIPQLVYFWSTDKTGLVPDLRYVPAAGVSREIQYTDVVDWVLAGPSAFLRDTVQANLYDNNAVVGPNLTAPDKDGLLVNLTIPPPQSLGDKRVIAQLRWSLQPLYEGAVRLQVNSQPIDASLSLTELRSYNLADRDSRSEDSSEYCVANGVVLPVANPGSPPAVLTGGDPSVNKEVVLAALSRDLGCAALVKKADKSTRQLWVVDGRGSGKPVATLVTFNGVPLSGQTWSRPAFVPMSVNPRVLVAVDGRLFMVRVPDGQASAVQTAGPVSDFAVAPEGKRIGLISNGSAFAYSLQIGDVVTLAGPGREIDVGLTECSHIAWSRLERVVVAGRRSADSYQLVEATIDGAIATAWARSFSDPILSVAALPAPASAPNSPEVALAQIGNGAYKVGPSSSFSLNFAAGSAPSPSPSAGGAAPGFGAPTYPFYVD
jgi:hypothetical protein